jgi:hypothetical protein
MSLSAVSAVLTLTVHARYTYVTLHTLHCCYANRRRQQMQVLREEERLRAERQRAREYAQYVAQTQLIQQQVCTTNRLSSCHITSVYASCTAYSVPYSQSQAYATLVH